MSSNEYKRKRFKMWSNFFYKFDFNFLNLIKNVIECDQKKNQVSLKSIDDQKSPPKNFTFDGAYSIDSITETIYNDVGFALVESVNSRIFSIFLNSN